MTEISQLLLPAIRWDGDRGFEPQRKEIESAMSAGVGGFIFFGGDAAEVRKLTADLRSRSEIPLLLAADLERGAGQQFHGATGLPPLAALGSLDDLDAIRNAARLTATEARELGINWIYGPVCDLDIEADNPIVGTRAFGSDPDRVAVLAAEWIRACQSEGALACAKHFPGHGRTTRDSHAELPTVEIDAATLRAMDLVPFRAAIYADVASIMSAHVSYPALDPSRAPATLSLAILNDLLRDELGFKGLIVTDALIMEGVLGDGGETGAVVRAIEAGCDLLLYPSDLAAVERAISDAIKAKRISARRIQDSLERRTHLADWAMRARPQTEPVAPHWSAEVAERCVHVVRGSPKIPKSIDLVLVDDDVGGPYPPPSRKPFLQELRKTGFEVTEREMPGAGTKAIIIALYGDIRAWKGRPGYSEASRKKLAEILDAATSAGKEPLILQFSHPRLANEIGGNVPILCAWGGEEVMQRAAARVLARTS